MIIVELNGGLGNQLQQYALSEKLKSLGKEVKLDISWYAARGEEVTTIRDLELDYFPGVDYEVCTADEKKKLLGSDSFLAKAGRKLGLVPKGRYTEHQMYDEGIYALDNRVLSGYWACEAYYADILPVLRQKLVFPPSDNPQNEVIKKQMKETNSVSVHLRRGDYLTGDNQKMFGGICTDEYYAAAIQYIKERVETPHFYLFSDDPEYARTYMEGMDIGTHVAERDAGAHMAINYTIIDINHGKDSFYDIELMSCCRHNICANSTFSFWGARLNNNPDKIMIRPLKQKNGVDWYQPDMMKQLWKGWTCLDEMGQAYQGLKGDKSYGSSQTGLKSKTSYE
ncbi:MAG: alpha-1,2-fucosyltransferase [Lachnospiraceae bacterium]|nr:alpha-1,2-fucosyltransferase [Lachnospiraceae bacterium]